MPDLRYQYNLLCIQSIDIFIYKRNTSLYKSPIVLKRYRGQRELSVRHHRVYILIKNRFLNKGNVKAELAIFVIVISRYQYVYINHIVEYDASYSNYLQKNRKKNDENSFDECYRFR